MAPSYLAEPIHKKWGKSIQARRIMEIRVRKKCSYNLNSSILFKKVGRIKRSEKKHGGLLPAGQKGVAIRGDWFYLDNRLLNYERQANVEADSGFITPIALPAFESNRQRTEKPFGLPNLPVR